MKEVYEPIDFLFGFVTGGIGMGIVDLNVLTWRLFWSGVVFLLVTGSAFSYGVLCLVQNKRKQAVVLLILSAICFVGFFIFAANASS